jgi:hypothetical protein
LQRLAQLRQRKLIGAVNHVKSRLSHCRKYRKTRLTYLLWMRSLPLGLQQGLRKAQLRSRQ